MIINWIDELKAFIRSKPKKLAFKIPFAYFLVILLTVAFSYLVLNQISASSAQKKINETSLQTITSIQTNVELMIENVNNYSKMIFSDHNLQNLLRQGDVYANLQTQAKVSTYLYNLMQAVPIIDSVYIYDNSGHRFSVGTEELPSFMEANVEETSWYEQALRNKGRYMLLRNASESVSPGSENKQFISFIRMIRDLDNTSPLGMLVINIKGESFAQAYANLLNQDSFQIAVLDEHNQIIVDNSTVDPGNIAFQEMLTTHIDELEQHFQQSNSGSFTLNGESEKYAVTYRSDGKEQWKFISVNSYDSVDTRNKSLVLLALALLSINGTVFFVSSFIISNSIIKPIHKLLRSMNKAPSGNFRKVNMELNSYEFKQLFRGYNQMIEQMDQMLKRKLEEQKTIRRAELNTLQAQIKPHFLYNTLDSITSLALSGRNHQVCELLEALGTYYRMSVSKGRDVITLGEEIEIVRNYMKIQKTRYQDTFEMEFRVDKGCLQTPIPKLVLQPLAENSLYHGIRPKGSKGTIRIHASKTKGGVELSISDDGVGMSEHEIDQILHQTEQKGEIRSFGLWGTLERLRMFYGIEDGITIHSGAGKGTTILIKIPNGADALWNN
ncbi:sensor histidine kinase [Paenibacillus sp. OK003]|uniref:cache domain-containing sensor histidine kinase n=1 Tax=Paenibacillus sp. OK003 TaxID=1884380 RepID=UPI0008B09075|nr:sensor histidine kinase [Paenibacillus sp. OK003]SEL81547.1 two-component system, sensor histidine kinase YesM [Paenibacillus sp. OK003]